MTIPNNTTLTEALYTQGTGITSSNPFITIYSLRDPTLYDVNYPIQKRWINFSSPVKEWVLENFNNSSGQTLANWILLSNGGPSILSLEGNTGGFVFLQQIILMSLAMEQQSQYPVILQLAL